MSIHYNQNYNQEVKPDLPYWLAFNRLNGLGAIRLKKIFNFFHSMEIAWNAEAEDLLACGLEANLVEEIILTRHTVNPMAELEKMLAENISALTLADEDYPELLKQIYAAPAILYYKGQLDYKKDSFSLAVVGTRKCSAYGQQITPILVGDLAQAGLTIVSGLALGIDSLAHEATLKQADRTIAVLGSGLDEQHIYPSHNRYLSEKIINNGGALVSEYPPGTEPVRHNFPQRNRIISGLSLGTLVIEAPEDSGSLLTARFALEQNREVFAVPGSIFEPNCLGPNNLIRMGAKLVTKAEDVLEALDLNLIKEFVATKKIVPDSSEEAQILNFLSHEPIHVDELVRLSKLDAAVINSTLTLMEMKGRVRNLGSLRYVIGR
ncbi:MAG TPA: DNA-processing protein DprA [bacterium]|nr:DNA-processing protein DprA [bacterium]HPL95231.1 DNA-processing protein DprA [bacterium]